MEKSVLLSVNPIWCEKISKVIFHTGDEKPVYEKSIEIRKTRPKIQTPFKVYIYCTKPKGENDLGLCLDKGMNGNLKKVGLVYKRNYEAANRMNMQILSGKIIGEFECDSIRKISYKKSDKGVWLKGIVGEFILSNSALSQEELSSYLKSGSGYAWSISNLVIYDNPKNLYDFYKLGFATIEELEDELCNHCAATEYGEKSSYVTPNGYVSCEGRFCDEAYEAYLEDKFLLSRPPQSWCYVVPQV